MRLGIIGCGEIADFTAWFARLNRRIRLAACCDLDKDKATQLARRVKIPAIYQDYTELLHNEPLDAVYLAVPHHLHYQMLSDAIQTGVPVLVEKPITRTLDEGVEITRFAIERDVPVGVNYQYRYDTGCYGLAKAVQGGALGKIHYARCNLPWKRELDYFTGSRWHASLAAAGGGTLITQGSHLLDVLLWALSGQPRYAVGAIAQRKFNMEDEQNIEVEDLAQGIIEMDDGTLVQICSAMVAEPEAALKIEIYGEKGTATYTDKPLPRVRFRGVRVKHPRPPVWGIHALQRSLEAFRSWVMEGRPYLIPARAALPALATVEAIYRSAGSGHREEINLPLLDGGDQREWNSSVG
jgi:predicted dehydrogenase